MKLFDTFLNSSTPLLFTPLCPFHVTFFMYVLNTFLPIVWICLNLSFCKSRSISFFFLLEPFSTAKIFSHFGILFLFIVSVWDRKGKWKHTNTNKFFLKKIKYIQRKSLKLVHHTRQTLSTLCASAYLCQLPACIFPHSFTGHTRLESPKCS